MSVWDSFGNDKIYQHYRIYEGSRDLRKWVDDTYPKVKEYLDKDWIDKLRNTDFYSRLWELEIAEWLLLTGLMMKPTNGVGFDFCIELPGGSRCYIEAVYSHPSEELKEIEKKAITSNGAVYNTPREQMALRYSSSLFYKANKIKEKYLKYIDPNDYTLLAVSSFGPDVGAWKSRDIFQLAILPIDNQLVHFSRDGEPLNPDILLATHEVKSELIKSTGSQVKKEFIYPGSDFAHIDAVMFSEASNLQQLLGTFSTSFSQDTNTPHIYQNYSGKSIPYDFTKYFYYHKWKDNGSMMSLELINPKVKLE